MSIDLIQNFKLETDSDEILKKVLRSIVPFVLRVGKNNTHTQFYVSVEPSTSTMINKGFLVCRLGDYKSDVNKGDHLFELGDHNGVVEYAMHLLGQADKKKFLEEVGDGYHDCFNHFDGSVDVGYKLVTTNTCWNALEIYLTHIYYGK